MVQLLRNLSLLLVCTTPALAQERLSPELLWELGRVSDVQVSPDGARMLYHLREYDLAANGGTTQIWVRDTRSGAARVLTSQGSNFNGRFTPDGQGVVFLSSRSGSVQIWEIALDGGEAQQVSDHDGGVSNMSLAPDGEHFAFTSSVMLQPEIDRLYDDLPLAEAKVFDDLLVRHWDQWNDGSYSHLFVLPRAGGAARDLMPGERVDTPLKPFGGGEQIAWSPDGQWLCYTAKRVDDPEQSTDSDLYLVSAAGGEHRNLTEGMPGYETNPSFAADGETLAFLSMARGGFESDRNRLMTLSISGGDKVDLTDGWDRTVGEFVWAADGKSLYVACDHRGTHQVYSVAAAGGAAQPVTTGRFQFGGIVPAPDGRSLYGLRMQTERPNEVVQIALGGDPDTGTPITDINGPIYEKLALPKVEERWFEATDGKQIHSWVVYPPDFDPAKKYPMLLYCQGGPQGQVGQWFSFRWNFHLMAAQGYIVLAVNRRGLPGFGREWNDQISGDWGGQAMQDLLSATDGMFNEPFVDRQRTAAVGASFGGYTVYWLMGHDQEDRFCSMIAHCGVFNLESMYTSTEELFFVNWDLGGPYWRDPDVKAEYARFSPSEFIESWDTPLLVIHGQRDYRVPLPQGLGAFTAAQVQGVPSRFLYFPDEGHWVLSPQNGVLWHRVFFDWLDRTCKPQR